MNSFEETGLRVEVLEAITEMGFEKPTPIQAKAIPQLLESNRDLIASAQTGTGKTAAFGLPTVNDIDTEDNNTQTLILCPTRELCLQIANDLSNFSSKIKGLRVVAVYGGANIDPQIKALNRGAHIVVGTPGRAKDLIKRKRLKLGDVSRVILDEADEMLTMGFKDDLDAILGETPTFKQTLLFSATMSREIREITKKYMDDPMELAAAKVNEGTKNVQHVYYVVNARNRYELLKRIADINPHIYGIVFCRTRMETKDIANKLMQDGYNADALHGDLSQAQRDEVMSKFRSRQLQILVATDVAARGLDVNELTHVINYNLPDEIEVYTHRSGRTGRAGNKGTSIAIVHTRERGKIRDIERRTGVEFIREMAPSGKDICTKQLYALIDKIEKVEVDEQQIEPFLPEIYRKLEWLSREELIKHFVSAEFNRFLGYYKDAEDINVSDKDRGRRNDGDDRRGDRKNRRNSNFSRLFVNAGSENGLNPARLIGLVNEALDSSDAAIGKIDILSKFSFFEIEKSREQDIIDSLNGEPFEGIDLSVEISKDKPKKGGFNNRRGGGSYGGGRRSGGDRKRWRN